MKNIKNMLLAGAVALGMTQLATATTYSGNAAGTTYTYITGSTANGVAVHKAIIDLLQSSGNQFFGAAYSGSAGSTAPAIGILASKVAVYKGTINGTPVYIKLALSGSELGLQQVKANLTVNFLDENLQTALAAANTAITGYANALAACTASASTGDYDVHVSDAAFSDTFQENSRFNGRVRLSTGSYYTYGAATPATISGGTGLAATAGVTGIVPFKFVANTGCPFSNVSSAQILALYGTFPAKLKLSEFTGVSSDATKYVYGTGRDIDSGTRLNALGLVGLPYNSVVQQYMPYSLSTNTTTTYTTNVVSGVTNVTTNNFVYTSGEVDAQNTTTGDIAFQVWPATTVNSITEVAGNAGYTSGGNLCKMLRSPATSFAATDFGALFSYSGVGDCDPQIIQSSSPVKELSFNGVTLGGATDFANNYAAYNTNGNLINGVYTFWCYEHLYLNPSSVTGNANGVAVANQIGTQLYNSDSYVLLNSMNVSRTTDGTAINY